MLYSNILLIDDDQDDIELFIEAVKTIDKNIKCRACNNPVKAWDELQDTMIPPDVIFLDYNMPVLNGSEFLKKIKNERKLKDIPVILISSPSKEFMSSFLKNNDILQYISKPCSYPEYVSVLKSTLEKPC